MQPRILNIGSLNVDHVYHVEYFVRPGETVSGARYAVLPGGKGLNQSIALARAGAAVSHAGKIGADGLWLKEFLGRDRVDTARVSVDAACATGHAIIQVNKAGENAILLHGGANQAVTEADVVAWIGAASAGDVLLLQNEVSATAAAMRAGRKQGMRIVFNPAPMDAQVRAYPLEAVDVFVLNETEGEGLTGIHDPEAAGAALAQRFPGATIVLTLGERGALCFERGQIHRQPATRVQAVDTTAAGDTFIGYFLATQARTGDTAAALAAGCRAAAVCVTRPGAAASIPTPAEVPKA